MSLLNQAYEEMAMLERKLTPDGEGGFDVSWRDGVHFQAAVNFDSSMQAKIAEKQGVTSLYTVTFPLKLRNTTKAMLESRHRMRLKVLEVILTKSLQMEMVEMVAAGRKHLQAV